MKFSFLRSRVLLVLFVYSALLSACGPTAREREEQRLEDSIQLDEERRQLLERTGQMLDSVSRAPEDSL